MTLAASGVAPAELDRSEIRCSAKLEVEAVRDYRAFLDLESAWNRLAQDAELDHPFLEHLWTRTWWECFGQGTRMHLLLVKDGGDLVGIAPLMETSVRMFGITLRRLGFFYNAHVPRSGFLISRKAQGVHSAIWNYLSNKPQWDLLQLCQLQAGSETMQSLSDLAAGSGYKTETWASSDCPYIPIRTTWDEYSAGLSAKHRANLRNRAKRLDSLGPAETESISTQEGLEAAMADGLRLEAAAWKGDAGTAISCDPALAEFYSRLAHRSAQRGWLRLRFLRSRSERIAFDYSLCYKRRVFLLKHGYDPQYAPFSPSQLLLQSAIQGAFNDSFDEYEILGDNTEWKQSWTDDTKRHLWLFVFSNTLQARYAHAAKFRIAPIVKRAVRREKN